MWSGVTGVRVTLWFMLIAVAGTIVSGQPRAISAEAPSSLSGSLNPESAALLTKVSSYVAGLNSLSFDARVQTTRKASDRETEDCFQYSFALQRPNLFSMAMRLPDEQLTVATDGSKVMYALNSPKICSIQPMTTDLGTMVGWITQQPAFRRLFSQQLSAGWTENVRQARCVEDNVDGKPCDRLELIFDRTDVAIWFAKGDSPIPMKLTADLSRTLNAPKGTLTTRIDWTRWETGLALPVEAFALRVPDGFKEVKRLDHPDEPGKGGSTPVPSVLGEQAPPFSLELLDSNSGCLRDHRGKHVVVLEFWATWCRPCRNALRDMEDQAARFKDGNVVFYAVNLMESRDIVAPFVEKAGLKLPVALDPNGELAEQLRLEAVPTSVVIGLDGTIQAMHVGYDRWLAKQIASEVETLARGDSLADGKTPLSPGNQLRYRLGLDSQAYCAVFVGY